MRIPTDRRSDTVIVGTRIASSPLPSDGVDASRSHVSTVKRIGKRILANPRLGRLAARTTMHEITKYERRLPRLWRLYARIPQAGWSSVSDLGAQKRMLDAYYRHLEDHVKTLDYQPTISILMPVYKTPVQFLRQALASVAMQTYHNWELCIADDCSGDPSVQAVLDTFREAFPDRVHVKSHDVNRGIAAASNSALDLATGDYVALLDHDDRLYPNALAEVTRAINLELFREKKRPEILYSDERVIGEFGELRGDPFFKPDWSPLLHLSVNYTTHLAIYDRKLLVRIGGFRSGFEGSQDHDLMLRAVEHASDVVHIPHLLYQWRAHGGSTAGSLDAKPYASASGVKAVTEACARRGHPADVTFEPQTGHYRIDFRILDPAPMVSIVIPTRDGFEFLRRCVASIERLTDYPNFEIVLVDNGTTERAAEQFLQDLAVSARATVVRDEGYFNFGRLCNVGVAAAQGEYVLLLNNDIEVLAAEWLKAMVGIAQLPEVGAVGAKLLYPDGHVQHGGVVGLGDVIAGHAGKGRSAQDQTYIHMVSTIHEVLAVTGACLLVSRADYDRVGGLDETWVPNAYGDVDLCLRLRELGLTNVYTPYAVLTHYESPTRGLNIEAFERGYMRDRWGRELLSDPYVNPNLHRSESYDVDRRFVVSEVPSAVFEHLVEASWPGNSTESPRR